MLTHTPIRTLKILFTSVDLKQPIFDQLPALGRMCGQLKFYSHVSTIKYIYIHYKLPYVRTFVYLYNTHKGALTRKLDFISVAGYDAICKSSHQYFSTYVFQKLLINNLQCYIAKLSTHVRY